MSSAAGTLYLVPNTLDFGVPADPPIDLQEQLPLGVIRAAAQLTHWLAENAKTTRAFLKRVDAVVPLTAPLQDLVIETLPRPQKGRSVPGADTGAGAIDALLAPLHAGHDVGLISEAGLPAVADPGALVVAAAHRAGLRVVALPGASSMMLALAASGLDGQSFAFVGYLPVEATARATRIRELDALSRRARQTQLMIETPYRNAALLAALVEQLSPTTRLSVSCGLTTRAGFTRTDTVARWRASPAQLPADVPTVFALLAS